MFTFLFPRGDVTTIVVTLLLMGTLYIQNYSNLSVPGECLKPIEAWQAPNDFILTTVRLMTSHAIWMQLQWHLITGECSLLIRWGPHLVLAIDYFIHSHFQNNSVFNTLTSLNISGDLLSGKLHLSLKPYDKSVLHYPVSELSTGIVETQGLCSRSKLQYNAAVLEVV